MVKSPLHLSQIVVVRNCTVHDHIRTGLQFCSREAMLGLAKTPSWLLHSGCR